MCFGFPSAKRSQGVIDERDFEYGLPVKYTKKFGHTSEYA